MNTPRATVLRKQRPWKLAWQKKRRSSAPLVRRCIVPSKQGEGNRHGQASRRRNRGDAPAGNAQSHCPDRDLGPRTAADAATKASLERLAKKKFGLLADLGTIEVPADYVHATQLGTFRKLNHDKFYYYNDGIADENFGSPSRILKPGDKLWVRAWKQIDSDETSSEERMNFVRSIDANAHWIGAQGASLVFDQKRTELPKGYWYASFDEKDRLPVLDGGHRVPGVSAYSDGDFSFRLGYFGNPWDDDDAFLSFSDVPLET